MKLLPLGAQLFHAGRRTDTNDEAISRNFAKTPRIAFKKTDILHTVWHKNDIIIPTKFENVLIFVTVDFNNIFSPIIPLQL